MKDKLLLLIKSFETLDINLLDVLLDDKRIYNYIEKHRLIKRIDSIFNEFKKNGDESLEYFPTECAYNSCQSANQYMMCFLGEKSNQYFNLVLEMNGDEIIGLKSCECLYIKREYNPKHATSIYMKFSLEEMHQDSLPLDVKRYYNKIKLALNILDRHRDEILNIQTITSWVNKHYNLWFTYNDVLLKFTEKSNFRGIYNAFHDLVALSRFKVPVQIALANYRINPTQDEIKKWLIENEREWDYLRCYINEEIDYKNPHHKGYFYECGYKISSEDFQDIFKFKDIFDKYYWTVDNHMYKDFTKDDINENW